MSIVITPHAAGRAKERKIPLNTEIVRSAVLLNKQLVRNARPGAQIAYIKEHEAIICVGRNKPGRVVVITVMLVSEDNNVLPALSGISKRKTVGEWESELPAPPEK